jgi:phytoene/squalene synthetase
MIRLFNELSNQCSMATTEKYSTSFSSAIRMLHKDLRTPIHNIYGFVRFADEIVDSFHDFDKSTLLTEFRAETFLSINRRISLNPILNSFQQTVNEYNIDINLIDAFFKSMEEDLKPKTYDEEAYREYIYGSAEVVGLMCLYVFCEGDIRSFEKLKPFARSLGSAFQKVNFMRDVKADKEILNRNYFPGVDFNQFDSRHKEQIERDIANDFNHAYEGIKMLPKKARFGVYVAYKYYMSLFYKIRRSGASSILQARIRIPAYSKISIVFMAGVRSQLRML